MKHLGTETVRVIRLELSEREVRILRTVLSGVNVTPALAESARQHGVVVALDDDDLTELYGALGQVAP